MIEALELADRSNLRQFLVQHFSLSELKNIAFDLHVDHELFKHETMEDFPRELISYLEHQERLGCLVVEVLKQRPSEDLAQLAARLPPCSPVKKVQIIVSRELLETINVAEFIREIARRLNVPEDRIVLVAAAWGSLRLLIGLPEDLAQRCTLAEIRGVSDKYKIVSVEQFDLLDSDSQNAWRLLACDYPPVQQDTVLSPAVSWQHVLRTMKLVRRSKAPSPSLPDSPLSLWMTLRRGWAELAEFTQLPVLRESIPAGGPRELNSLPHDNAAVPLLVIYGRPYEIIPLHKNGRVLFTSGDSHVIVPVEGTSMQEENILAGDFVVLRLLSNGETPQSGDIVAAEMAGDREVTLKKYVVTGGKQYLQARSSDPQWRGVNFEFNDSVVVRGVAIAVLKPV